VINDQQTLREQIADSLREALVNGQLKPGQRVQEIEIASQYKTSRTPVREALRQLEAEGFVQIRPRRGAVVAPITAKDIREFYELKGLLESYAAERAVANITDDEIDRLEELNSELKRLYEMNEVARMVDVHNEFHEVFVRACGNERLAALIKNLVNQYQRFRIALSHTDSVEDSVAVHAEIVSAFRLRDTDHVAKLVKKNSTQGAEALIKRLMTS
jgi:DNA-binding GntR family transcriptional regulator